MATFVWRYGAVSFTTWLCLALVSGGVSDPATPRALPLAFRQCRAVPLSIFPGEATEVPARSDRQH